MKQTEIGLIPDDWEVKTLGCITTHVDYRGKTPRKTNIGIQLITAKNIRMGYIDYKNNQEFVSPKEYSEIMKRGLPKKGDVLITTEAPAGNVAQIDNENVALAQRVIKYRGNNILNNNYLCYYFLSDAFQNLLHSLNTGGTVQGIKGSLLHTLPVIVPPLTEQQRIAKALSDIDALISTTEKLIQKKKNIKQGTMQTLLTGKKRLPGFGPQTKSQTYKQTELGPIPEDWEVKSLGEIFEFRPNNTFTRDCLNDSKGKYQNVHYGDVLIKYPSILDCSKETIPFINEGINVKFSKYGIVEGDIIIADTAEDETVGKVVEIFNLGEKKIVSGLHTFLCRKITDDFAPKWLGYFMNQAIFHNQLLPFITGTKVSAISRSAIQNVKVLIPSKEEQTAIANVLSSMDKETETLNTKLEKYRNLKTAMMQQLLTGKIRLVK